MDFNFSEEQVMLRDSVSRYIQDNYDFEARRKVVANELGFSADNWQQFADLGWLSIPFAEEHGGFGGGATDVMVIMEELGKGLVAEPYLATVMLFGATLAKSGSAQAAQWLPTLIEGGLQGALAYTERQSRYCLHDVATTANKEGDGYVINGEKTVVFNGQAADKLIVSARTSGSQTDAEGVSLFLVDANTKGISRTAYRMMDGQLVANIQFNDVAVAGDSLVGCENGAADLLQAVVDDAMVAACGEALGLATVLNAETVEYAKTREQFGVAIGSFQALQHRMVDNFADAEQMRSLLYRTVCSIDENSPEAQKNRLALKVLTGQAGYRVASEAIQLHGGMGITDELSIGHYAKRMMMINSAFGDADYQLQRFCDLAA